MIRPAIAYTSVAFLFSASPILAASVGDRPPPTNPCNPAARYRLVFEIPGVSGDGSATGCDNGVHAETVITCGLKDKVGRTADFAIDYVDAGATLLTPSTPVIGNNAVCNVGAGDTVSFTTSGNVPAPWGSGANVVAVTSNPGSLCPAGSSVSGCFTHGSIRLLSTTPAVNCTAVRLDMNSSCAGGVPLPKQLPFVKLKHRGD